MLMLGNLLSEPTSWAELEQTALAPSKAVAGKLNVASRIAPCQGQDTLEIFECEADILCGISDHSALFGDRQRKQRFNSQP